MVAWFIMLAGSVEAHLVTAAPPACVPVAVLTCCSIHTGCCRYRTVARDSYVDDSLFGNKSPSPSNDVKQQPQVSRAAAAARSATPVKLGDAGLSCTSTLLTASNRV